MKTPYHPSVWLAATGLLLGTSYSQVASVPPTVPKADPETIELSPFVVTTDKDVGYLAANTMSGSRLNTPLVDTPASISEMTKEFLEDIGANDMMAAAEYAMGFQAERDGGNDNTTQFNSNQTMARGLSRSTASRDFFNWGINSDTFSVERLSFSRGPNAILYGVGSAGGIVNSMSKRAGFRTQTEVNLRTDENGTWRFHVDHNQRLTKTLALRCNLLAEDQRTWRELEYSRSKRLHFAGTWRPLARTEIRADYERGVQNRLLGLRFNARDYFLMWVDGGKLPFDRAINPNFFPYGTLSYGTVPRLSYDADAGKWSNLQRLAQTKGRLGFASGGDKLMTDEHVPFTAPLLGRASTTDNENWTSSVFLQQEVVRNLYVELAVNRQSEQRTINRAMSHDQLGVRMDANRFLSDGTLNPRMGQMYLEGQALLNYAANDTVSQRASATYEWNSHSKWLGHHRWLAMVTAEDSDGGGSQWNEANLTPLNPALPAFANAQNSIYRRTYVNFQGGTRSYNQDPFRQPNPPTPFADPANALAGTVTAGFFCSNRSPTKAENRAAMAAGQSGFWNNRLIVTYGFRRDEATRQTVLLSRNATTQEVTGVIWNPTNEYSGDTRTQGVVVHATNWLSLYGNRSDNYTPQSALDMNGNNIGNVRGKGYDVGLKFRLGENRLYGRIGTFQTSAENQSGRDFSMLTYVQAIWVALEGATGEHVTKFTGSPISNSDTRDTEASGYEIELTANPIKGLALTANYATLEVKAANLYPITRAHIATNRAQWAARSTLATTLNGAGSTVGGALGLIDASLTQADLQEGRESLNNYPASFNTFGRYQFQSERLKGWSIGTGARFRAGRVLGYSPTNATIRAPKLFTMDANLAYRRSLWNRRVEMRLQLNVQNLLDNHDLIWSAIDPTTLLKNDYTLFTPRGFALTASFSYR